MHKWALLCVLTIGCSGDKTRNANHRKHMWRSMVRGLTLQPANILGNWTSTFANQIEWETCGIAGLKPDDMDWINGAAFSIDGTSAGLYATFTRTEGALLRH